MTGLQIAAYVVCGGLGVSAYLWQWSRARKAHQRLAHREDLLAVKRDAEVVKLTSESLLLNDKLLDAQGRIDEMCDLCDRRVGYGINHTHGAHLEVAPPIRELADIHAPGWFALFSAVTGELICEDADGLGAVLLYTSYAHAFKAVVVRRHSQPLMQVCIARLPAEPPHQSVARQAKALMAILLRYDVPGEPPVSVEIRTLGNDSAAARRVLEMTRAIRHHLLPSFEQQIEVSMYAPLPPKEASDAQAA